MAASDFTKDYLAGWEAAREHYQRQNSVPPYPPGYYDVPEPEPAPVETPAPEDE